MKTYYYNNQFYIIDYEMFDVQHILLQIKYLEGVIRTSEATIADLEAESVRVTKVWRFPPGGDNPVIEYLECSTLHRHKKTQIKDFKS